MFTDFKPKFTKRYTNLTEVAVSGLKQYVAEVKSGKFPDEDHSYAVDDKEYDKFLTLVEKRKQPLKTLTDRAYTEIEELIVTLQLAPGERGVRADALRAPAASGARRSARRCSGSRASAW